MYHVSAEGVDERMINVHFCFIYITLFFYDYKQNLLVACPNVLFLLCSHEYIKHIFIKPIDS